mgnify:CR=1 FL=1
MECQKYLEEFGHSKGYKTVKIIKSVLYNDVFYTLMFKIRGTDRLVIAYKHYCNGFRHYRIVNYEKHFLSKQEGNLFYTQVLKTERRSQAGNIYYNLDEALKAMEKESSKAQG